MTEAREAGASPSTSLKAEPGLLEQYGCGPIRFSGTNDGLYERHLLFDDVVAPSAAGAHERFKAAAHSVRDVLSQRWVLTETTYDRENPKRVHGFVVFHIRRIDQFPHNIGNRTELPYRSRVIERSFTGVENNPGSRQADQPAQRSGRVAWVTDVIQGDPINRGRDSPAGQPLAQCRREGQARDQEAAHQHI